MKEKNLVNDELTSARRDVLTERERQINTEE